MLHRGMLDRVALKYGLMIFAFNEDMVCRPSRYECGVSPCRWDFIILESARTSLRATRCGRSLSTLRKSQVNDDRKRKLKKCGYCSGEGMPSCPGTGPCNRLGHSLGHSHTYQGWLSVATLIESHRGFPFDSQVPCRRLSLLYRTERRLIRLMILSVSCLVLLLLLREEKNIAGATPR